MILKKVVPKNENFEKTRDPPAIKNWCIIGSWWKKFKALHLHFFFISFFYFIIILSPLIAPTPKLRPFVLPSQLHLLNPFLPPFLIALPPFFRKRCYVPNNSSIAQLLDQSKGNMVELTSPLPLPLHYMEEKSYGGGRVGLILCPTISQSISINLGSMSRYSKI